MTPFRRLLSYALRYPGKFLRGLACVVVTTGVADQKPTPVSKDMRGYAAGAGRQQYTTKTFSVMLPSGYHKNSVPVRLSQGGRVRASLALRSRPDATARSASAVPHRPRSPIPRTSWPRTSA